MKSNTVKILAISLIIIMLVGLISGCKKEEETYDNYSYGLTAEGIYENIDQYPCDLPNFKSWSFTYDEVLTWGFEYLKSTGTDDLKDVDDYVYLYGKELLASLGLTNKEIAEEGDIVSVDLQFYIDGKQLDDYTSTGNYKVTSDGDAIVSSFVGHKAKDEYEVEYTFPDDDQDHPSETANVKVVINSVVIADPIASGVVEANLEVIGKSFDNVTDTESFLAALRPRLAEETLELFIEDRLQSIEEITPPDEYIEFEVHRLKCRLQQLGYTYENYLVEANMTDKDARDYCALVARENYLAMLIFNDLNYQITEEELADYYGDNLEYIISVQGEPYVRLNMIREFVIYAIADLVTLEEADGEVENTTTAIEQNSTEIDQENAPVDGTDDVTQDIEGDTSVRDNNSDVDTE
jgi:hypothetical protein